jgi:hypothetical protein
MHDRQCAGRSEVTLSLVEARETGAPPGATPLHWRLLTTLPARTAAEAAEAVRPYRLRWRIEQTFRQSRLAELDRGSARRLELLLQAAGTKNHAARMGPSPGNRYRHLSCIAKWINV